MDANGDHRTCPLGVLSGGFQDQPGNLFGMGDQRKIACLHFDGLGTHAPGHEALEIRVDSPVFCGNGVEARLRSPGRLRGFAREQDLLKRLLDRVENPCLRFRQVAREIVQKGGRREAVAKLNDKPIFALTMRLPWDSEPTDVKVRPTSVPANPVETLRVSTRPAVLPEAARAYAKKVVASRRLSIKFLREAGIIEKPGVLARPYR